MKNYDIFAFGNASIGIIQTPAGEHVIAGGPILFAAWTAHQLGHSVGVLTKTASKDKFRLKEFPMPEEDIFWRESSKTMSNRVVYQTESMETRVVTNLSRADAYKIEEFPDISTKVIQYCGLIAGEINLEIIRFISNKAPIAIDAQGLVRQVFAGGALKYVDWDDKRIAMPLIHYFKADAAEAAILTGFDTENVEGRVSAAKRLLDWGAKEVVISHYTGLIAVNESGVVSSPFKNRNSSGRTGRGDTSFTSYITERFTKNPTDAIKFATALTSMKMEIPGPFRKTRQDVEAFIKDFY